MDYKELNKRIGQLSDNNGEIFNHINEIVFKLSIFKDGCEKIITEEKGNAIIFKLGKRFENLEDEINKIKQVVNHMQILRSDFNYLIKDISKVNEE